MNKPMRSKLFNQKKWLTLPEAARHLSDIFGEAVTEANILQFALNGNLTLSVNLVNDVMSICGLVVSYTQSELSMDIANNIFPSELKRKDLPCEIVESIKKSFKDMMEEDFPKCDLEHCCALEWEKEKDIIENNMLMMVVNGLRVEGVDQYLVQENYKSLEAGVWDLSMLGTERIEIERRYHNLTGGPDVKNLKKGSRTTTGVCLKGDDEKIFKLQMPLDDRKRSVGAIQLEKLKRQVDDIFYDYYEESHLKVIYNSVAKRRMEIWQKHAAIDGFQNENLCSLDYLPEDSALVVRNQALIEFEKVIGDADQKTCINQVKDVKTKSQALKDGENGHVERHAAKREQILGAAFAVLAMCPDQCSDKNGKPLASKIAKMIDVNAKLFWEDNKPPLALETIEELIREWIKKIA
ncbi:MAG: hypothetical protein ACXVLQ_19285 [Bacteriovorax sp.]